MRFRTEPWLKTSGSARSLLVALPLLALLALALLPASAHAERGSAEVNYGDPSDLESFGPGPGTTTTTHGTQPQPGTSSGHHHSTAPTTGEEPVETTTGPGGESQSPEHHRAGTAPSVKGGNHPPGGNGSGKDHATEPAVGSSHTPVRNVTPGSRESTPKKAGISGDGGGGGSSPLLPVLIAMAVLAAASIGVVIVRQRRGDSGPDGYAG